MKYDLTDTDVRKHILVAIEEIAAYEAAKTKKKQK